MRERKAWKSQLCRLKKCLSWRHYPKKRFMSAQLIFQKRITDVLIQFMFLLLYHTRYRMIPCASDNDTKKLCGSWYTIPNQVEVRLMSFHFFVFIFFIFEFLSLPTRHQFRCLFFIHFLYCYQFHKTILRAIVILNLGSYS